MTVRVMVMDDRDARLLLGRLEGAEGVRARKLRARLERFVEATKGNEDV